MNSNQQNMPILIVDDYKTTLRIVRTLLKQIGFDNVEEALTADDAIARVRKKSYGLVICDWNMSPKSGFDLLQEIRSDGGLCETPFVMIVPPSDEDYIEQSIAAGADSHITKPFKANALKTALIKALG